jgi:hypothetical protein
MLRVTYSLGNAANIDSVRDTVHVASLVEVVSLLWLVLLLEVVIVVHS